MQEQPRRIFLDTNIYIIGAAIEGSPEAAILEWAGFGAANRADVVVIVSDALFQQISRVAQRLRHKDWAGELISQIWRSMAVEYVLLDEDELQRLESRGEIPREDVTVFLTARNGRADCFVSANHELVRVLAGHAADFECLTPAAFVDAYLEHPP